MKTKVYALVFLGMAACAPLVVNGVDFGTDSSRFANDGECDDPRFAGAGMARDLYGVNIKEDATDCARLFEAQQIRPVRSRAQSSPAECRSIDFGNNSSEFANDGDCDDPRFTGPGTFSVMLGDDEKADANDCRQLCASGGAWLR